MLQGPRTLGRIFNQRVDRTPNKYAIGWIENEEVKSLTFKQYKTQIEILATSLHKLGFHIGDKVSILGQTSKDWHLLDMAILLSRGCVVPIYPNYLHHEVDYIFRHSDSSYIIVENDKQLEKILPYLGSWITLKAIITINEISEDVLKKVRNSHPLHTLKDLIKIGSDEIKTNPDYLENQIKNQLPEEIATIIYTSGTTGEPKGAVITHHALSSMLINIDKTIQGSFSSSDITLTFLPLAHVMGRCDSLLPLVFGWQSVYAESMERLLENIQIVRPTIMLAVPRIFEKIYAKVVEQVHEGNIAEKQIFKWANLAATKYFEKIEKDLSPTTFEILEFKLAQQLVFSKIYNKFGGRIRYFVSGGAPLSPKIIQFLRNANLTILEGYGLTETIAPCCLNPLSKQVAGTVGRPLGDVQISFEMDGEILIKSEALFKEYYKNPTATQEAFKDGWFHTGDIGQFTPQGYLKITDRKKDLIKTSGGKFIAPQKIENIAKSQPHISHMVVIGDQRNYVVALVAIEKDRFLNMLEELELPTNCTVADIAAHPKVKEVIASEIELINQDLAQFETIKKFEVLKDEFKIDNFLTPSLKVKRKLATEHYKDIIEAMYQ